MAGGQLVPHTLPNGQTIMVPDYLAPKALALPNVQAPQGPDMRVAGPGGGPMAQWGNEIPTLPQETQAEEAASMRAQILGQRPAAPSPALSGNSHATKPQGREAELASLGGKKPSGVDPSTVVIGKPQQPQSGDNGGDDPNGGMDPLVRRVFNEGPAGGGGGPRRPGAMEVGTIKEEREPGKQLLPEQMWAAGLAERPAELYERDPNAPISTIGTDEPVMREKLTPIEQGAKSFGERGVREYERQVADQHMQNVAAKSQLVQQSELMDQQLATIAERRDRIAKLQDVAEKRAQEANSMEPRTRQQIWESSSPPAIVFGILGTALGAYGASLGHHSNWAMDQLNKTLDSAVEDERYKHESRRKIGLDAKSDLDKAMAIYGDLDLATIDTRNRKLANVMAMTQNMLSDRGLDAQAKDRGAQLMAQLQAQYMEGIRQQQDMLTGHVIKQEVNYKQGAPTGGGAAPKTTLQRLEEAARAKKAVNTITGADDKPKANPTELAALNAQEAGLAPLKSMLARYKGADSIPGAGDFNIGSKALRKGLDVVGGSGTASKTLDSDEERANAMTINRARLAYRHATTGAGGAESELAAIDQAFAGASTKADFENAVRISEEIIAEARRLSGGGASSAKAPAPAASTFRPE